MSDLPIDNAPLWMARLKAKRARDHIGALAAELERYRLDPPLEHRIRQEAGEWFADTTILSGPVYAGAIAGDVVHNLRASLDVMASELARLNERSDKGVYFPIAENEDALAKQIADKNFRRAGDDAVKLLKTFAPYRGGNIALRALHELDIQDKHTALVPTSGQIATKVSIPYRDGQMVPQEATVTHEPDSIKLVFPDDSAFAGDEVVPALENLAEVVDGVLEAFARLVAARA